MAVVAPEQPICPGQPAAPAPGFVTTIIIDIVLEGLVSNTYSRLDFGILEILTTFNEVLQHIDFMDNGIVRINPIGYGIVQKNFRILG